MKILHYALGFPPYRTGGLTKFCMDLMIQQNIEGHQVAMLWPGQMGFLYHKVAVKDRGIVKRTDNSGIRSFEVINPLPVSYDEGISNFEAFTLDEGENVYRKLLQLYEPDVIHVHTLMGLHRSFLVAAKKEKIRLIFSAHDFFPICPKVTMFRNGQLCPSVGSCAECGSCNSTSLSIKKIRLLQSPIYKVLKDSPIIRKLRKQHRDEFHSKNANSENSVETGNSEDYKKLRNHYYQILRLMDMIHYNSTLTKNIYERYFEFPKSTVIKISHADIFDNRKMKKFTNHIRFTYLGAQSGAKGYFVLKKALDKLWEVTHNFELNVYFEPIEPAIYIKSHPRYTYSDLSQIMDKTDMLITPSVWYETFGYTVLEALSYGVPVLISGNVGAKDILVAGAGIIVEDMDVDKLYNQLREIVHHKLEQMNIVILKDQDIITLEDMSKSIKEIYY